MDLTIAPGQSLQTIPLLFETYGTGPQNLYVNLSGMDVWVDNSILPHCAAVNENATCDVGIESDMPRVVSQDSIGSGTDGMALTIGIMTLLLIGASFVIVVLIRRDNSGESIFYDDDDDWEEDESSESEESEVVEVTPTLPPMAPEKAQLESAVEVLESNKESAEVAEDDQQNDESEESEDATSEEKLDEEVESKGSDLWTDVEHSD